MFKTLTALAMLPITLGFYNSFEEGSDLSQVAESIAQVVNMDGGSPFELGDDRNVGDALDSNLFNYDGKSFK